MKAFLPSADGQDLQQAGGCHLEGGTELGHSRFLQQLEWLTKHGLCPAQLGQNIEQATRDGQGDVHWLVANAQCKHCHQQEALLGFWDGDEIIK